MVIENKKRKKAEEIFKKARTNLERVVEDLVCEAEEANDHLKKKIDECMQGFNLMQQQRDLSISLAAATDLMAGLQTSLEAGMQMSGMDCGGIYLLDSETGALNLIIHQGLSEEFIRTASTYDKDSENSLLVRAGKPIYILYNDLNVPMAPADRIEGLQMFAMLPLVDSGNVIGCMNLGSHTIEDIPPAGRIAIETTAAQIGSALSRLKAREALQESEGHFRSLMETASNFAVYRLVVDEASPRKFRVHFVSPSAKYILGISDPMQFESWYDNMHPEDVDRIVVADSNAIQTKKFDEQYRVFNHKMGEWRWIHSISTGIIDEERGNHYVNGIMFDVTSKLMTKQMLRKKEQHWRTLMDSATNFAIYGLFADDRKPYKLEVEYVSPSMSKILGIPDPMKLDAWFEHIHPDDVDRVVKANSKAFETHKFDEQFRYYNNETGKWGWIHIVSSPVMDDDVWTGDVIGIMIDITKRKNVENKLKENEIELENRAKTLEETNTALRVVINNREKDKAELEDKIFSNMKSTVLPYLEKIKKRKLDSDVRAWIKIIESNLVKLTFRQFIFES